MQIQIYPRALTNAEMYEYIALCEYICWNIYRDWILVKPGGVRLSAQGMHARIESSLP